MNDLEENFKLAYKIWETLCRRHAPYVQRELAWERYCMARDSRFLAQSSRVMPRAVA
jgi:hypothetical protein